MNKALIAGLFITILVPLINGCSENHAIVFPEPGTVLESIAADTSHQLWGLWQFTANPAEDTLDVIPLRATDFHLNVLPFLEPPALKNLTLESLEFNGDIVEVTIGLTHPFIGLKQFSGFDVCGILITKGTFTGFNDPLIMMAGEGDTRLLNPDGWTRWWNASEFPVNDGTIFCYKDGLLGTPDMKANYNCTLNAYKYFCDDLKDPNDTLDKINASGRGVFTAGVKNKRHYTIELGDGLIFNYAVDACWQFPVGIPPYEVPDDFGPDANRTEAYRASVHEVKNTLWNDGSGSGGDLILEMDVYDWFEADLNTVQVESPGNFDAAVSSSPIGGGTGYATYQINIENAHPTESGTIGLFITVQSNVAGYGGFLPGKPVCAYFSSSVNVSNVAKIIEVLVPNGGGIWYVGSSHHITWNSTGSISDVKIEYYKDEDYFSAVTIVSTTPNDGSFVWDPIPNDPTTKAKVRIADVDNATTFDDSDDYFTIETPAPPNEWNQLQNNPAHIGDVAGETSFHPPLELDWSVSLSSVPNLYCGLEGTPIVGDGKILILYPGPDVGFANWAECRSFDDGSFLWKSDLNPSLAPGPYIGTQTGCYANGKFFVPGDAIRALDAEKGEELWDYVTNPLDTMSHGLVYEDGKVYAHLSDEIHILNADTGDLVKTIDCYAGFADFQPFTIQDGWAFYQSDNEVRALILATGDEQWNFPVDFSDPDDSVRCAPTVPGDGRVYFGSFNGYFYAVNQSDGALAWKKPIHGGAKWVFDTAAYSDDRIFYGESAGGVGAEVADFVCRDAGDGAELWKYPAPSGNEFDSWCYSSPIVVNGVVYVASELSGFFGFDVETGGLAWSYQPSGIAQSDPAFANGRLLFLSNDYKIWCFKMAD